MKIHAMSHTCRDRLSVKRVRLLFSILVRKAQINSNRIITNMGQFSLLGLPVITIDLVTMRNLTNLDELERAGIIMLDLVYQQDSLCNYNGLEWNSHILEIMIRIVRSCKVFSTVILF